MSSDKRRRMGVYQCHPEDDVKNFKIRVTVWKVTSGKSEEESYDFKWQEKVFSMKEIDKLKEMRDEGASDYEKQCKKQLEQWMRMRHKMLKEHRLYSLTNEELAARTEEADLPTDYEKSRLTATEMNFREARKSYSDDAVVQERMGGHLAGAKLIERPTREELLRQFFRSQRTVAMSVMFDYRASLQQQQQQQEQQEQQQESPEPQQQEVADKTQKLLLTVSYDTRDRLLTVRPDFTSQPLILGNWRYTIDNVSSRMSEAQKSRVFAQEREKSKLKLETRQLFRATDFDTVPDLQLRVCVRGEIVSAAHFEFQPLRVHFFVDLPPDWWVPHAASLAGTTQLCSTKVSEVDDVAYFSHPFEFELHHEHLVPPGADDAQPRRWPVMYFEVASQDTWTRHRTEGYGFLPLPQQPGPHAAELQCWRPTGASVVCELRRFFIGGTPELEDATFANVPSDFSGQHLSKFGLSTQTTGQLQVRMHCIHQSAAAAEAAAAANGAKRSAAAAAESRGFAAPAHVDLMRALNAFQRARQRLQAARSAHASLGLATTLRSNRRHGSVDEPDASAAAGDESPEDDSTDDLLQQYHKLAA